MATPTDPAVLPNVGALLDALERVNGVPVTPEVDWPTFRAFLACARALVALVRRFESDKDVMKYLKANHVVTEGAAALRDLATVLRDG